MSKVVRLGFTTPVDWQIHAGASNVQTPQIGSIGKRIMDSDTYTLVALGAVVVGAWLLEHLGWWGRSHVVEEMERQLQKSADTIRGAPLE
jgi:hypothetical protein